MSRLRLVLWLVLVALMASTAHAQTPTNGPYWLDISMGGPLIDWFNETASPTDIARIENINQAATLLPLIRTGRKMVVFKSIPDAEARLPQLADQVQIVGYNLETGPSYETSEIASPVDSVKAMRALADEYGLLLALGPDHDLVVAYGPQLAPYADIFVLQIQRQQDNPPVVEAFVAESGSAIQAANPAIELSVQIRAEDLEVADLIPQLQPSPRGVSILTSPESVETTKALVAALRALPAPTAPTALGGTGGGGPPPAENEGAIPSTVIMLTAIGVLLAVSIAAGRLIYLARQRRKPER